MPGQEISIQLPIAQLTCYIIQMQRLNCPHCGTQNFERATYCAKCQRPLSQSPARTTVPIRTVPPRAAEPTQMGPPPHARQTAPVLAQKEDKTEISMRPLVAATKPSANLTQRPLETLDEAPTRVVSQASMGHLLERLTPKAAAPVTGLEKKPLRQILEEPTVALEAQKPAFVRRPTAPALTTTLIDDVPPDEGTVVQSHPIPALPASAAKQALAPQKPQTLLASDRLRRAAKTRPIDLTESEERADTIVGARAAKLSRILCAAWIDTCIVLFSGLAVAAAEMLLFEGRWPKDKGLLESVAVWAHVYRHTALRAFGVTCGFFLIYSTWGALSGQTVGRAWMRLVLLRTSGKKATLSWASLRAVVGLLSVGCFGAGAYWMIVDSQHRALSDILLRAQIGSTKRT